MADLIEAKLDLIAYEIEEAINQWTDQHSAPYLEDDENRATLVEFIKDHLRSREVI